MRRSVRPGYDDAPVWIVKRGRTYIMSTTAERQANMHAVLVPREKLLDQVRENRDKHEREYAEAMEGYKAARLEWLRDTLALEEADEQPTLHFPGMEPRHYLDDYDTAISLLEWAEDSHIELSRDEFRQYVLDEWKWKREFTATNIGYVGEHGEYPKR